MKVFFLKLLAAIFSAIIVGGFVFITGIFDDFIKSFYEDPFGTTLGGFSLLTILWIFCFGPLFDLIDDYCD